MAVISVDGPSCVPILWYPLLPDSMITTGLFKDQNQDSGKGEDTNSSPQNMNDVVLDVGKGYVGSYSQLYLSLSITN